MRSQPGWRKIMLGPFKKKSLEKCLTKGANGNLGRIFLAEKRPQKVVPVLVCRTITDGTRSSREKSFHELWGVRLRKPADTPFNCSFYEFARDKKANAAAMVLKALSWTESGGPEIKVGGGRVVRSCRSSEAPRRGLTQDRT